MQDTLCNSQITCNYLLVSAIYHWFSQTVAQTRRTSAEMQLNNHLLSYKYIITLACKFKMFVQRAPVTPTAKMAVLCCQSFTLETYTYPLSQRVSSFIILLHNKVQIIFLAALKLHSGESSQNSKCSPVANIKSVVFCSFAHTRAPWYLVYSALDGQW